MPQNLRTALIIPALNEAETLGLLLRQLPRPSLAQIIVVDNGSRDLTPQIARDGGAEVLLEPKRGYGRACQRGLAAINPVTQVVAFMDADLSDDPDDLIRLLNEMETGNWDMIVGSRVLGRAQPGSLTPLQRFGNWLTTRLIVLLWGVRFTDLGPMRLVATPALRRMALTDGDFGWNVEMQAKAASLGLRVLEVPVNYRPRAAGKSKISGTLRGSFAAGVKILYTVFKCWKTPPR